MPKWIYKEDNMEWHEKGLYFIFQADLIVIVTVELYCFWCILTYLGFLFVGAKRTYKSALEYK